MKNLTLAMSVVVAAGVFLAGGCVGDREYKEALAANQRANLARQQAEASLNEVRAKNLQLEGDLQLAQNQLNAKQQEIDILAKARSDLQRAYDELAARPVGTSAGPGVIDIENVLPSDMDAALKELARAYPDLIEYLPKYGMLKLKSDLTFPPGGVSVNAQAVEALKKVAQIMQGSIASNFNLYVAGHTDDIPIKKAETLRAHPDNWYLSAHRALAVQHVLQDAGLAGRRMAALGFGEYHPVAPNAPGNKGNAANRRVELWVVPPNRFLTGATAAGGSSTAAPSPAPVARTK